MEDRFGHRISYLRISITDRCNERCRYCLPEERQDWLPRSDILTYEEILRVVRAGAELGIRKVRVTGGEPLVRRDVLSFLARLRRIPGIQDVGLSTNGTLLAAPPPGHPPGSAPMATHLAAAGVRTVNISLDTLDPERYAAITGRDWHARAVAGIDAAVAAGFEAVKLNCVLMKGRNEQELAGLAAFAFERGCLLRFIELMPVSTREVLTPENFLSAGAARRILESSLGPLEPDPSFRTNGPASYFRVPGRNQRIGFIGALTNLHFCSACDKLRLTADGRLRPCLGSHLEFDLRSVLRNGATDADIRRFFLEVVDRKPKEHDFRGQYVPGRHMTAIGG